MSENFKPTDCDECNRRDEQGLEGPCAACRRAITEWGYLDFFEVMEGRDVNGKGLPAFVRRLRAETVVFNGVPVKFYRKRQKWHYRATGGKVKVKK